MTHLENRTTSVNTVIIEADNLWAIADLIGTARYTHPTFFEVEQVWSHGTIHRKHCVMVKGGNSVLKMIIEIAKSRKYVKCYYSEPINGQIWDDNEKKFKYEGK